MEKIVPWRELIACVQPSYYPEGKPGRRPIGLERMLRMYFLQQWFGLGDEALEDAIYDSQAFRTFLNIDLNGESVPDATTLLKFRHLLEANRLTEAIFEQINLYLEKNGLLMRQGTIVDATIIAAPSSTKNRQKERDPEMHQTKKGNEWHFGMKAHIGVDADSGLTHKLVGTAANVADIAVAADALHGKEEAGYVDAGYTGVEKRAEVIEKHPDVTWVVAAKRGKINAMPEGPIKSLTKKLEKFKAQVRAKVEHPFHIIKDLFKFRKVRYRGLAKNTAQLFTLFGLANLVIAKRKLMSAVAA